MICVVNKSTLVSPADVKTMVAAVAAQLRFHAAPAWGKLPIPVAYVTTEHDAPSGAWVLVVLDDADQANALGYHSETQGGVIYGRVFTRPVLSNGGDALTKPLSVASVLSHECLEILVNPHVNLQADAFNGSTTALEIGDPVESDSYKIGSTTVSNFVYPSWFDPQAQPGTRFDYLGVCTAPFQIAKGGYAVVTTAGGVKQVFGESYPEWRRSTKETPLARTARLLRPSQPGVTPAPADNGGLLRKLTGFWPESKGSA